MTAALALEVVGLFGFAYLTDSHVPGISPLAATSIFIDGTKDILPTDDSQAPDRMRNALGGAYDQCGAGSTGPCANNKYIDYSRDFGILTGGAGYNESKLEATNMTIAAIREAQADPTYTPGDGIYVVGYSQGANASSDVIKAAEELNSDADPTNDLDLSDVTFVMLGNGARNDGGLWARLPAGVYVPFLGLSFGASTNPVTPSDDPNAPNVILITKQYDGAGDVPRYMLLNPVADLNAAMGFFYVHNGYYQDVDVDLDNDGDVDEADVVLAEADDEHYIVTKNGNVTDIVIINQPGDLPITQPLKALGVPDDVILAIDPILRWMIEAGYDRVPDGGTYPSEPVHIGLFPKPGKIFKDLLALDDVWDQTEENVEDLADANTLQLASDPGVGNSLMAAKQVDPAPAEAPEPPKPPVKPQSQWPTFVPQQWVPQVTKWQAPPAPPVEELPPTVEEVPPTPTADQLLIDPDSLGNTAASPSSGSTGTATPGAGLQKIAGAVKQVYDATLGRLIPKPATTTAPTTTPDPVTTSTDPDPDPGTGTEPGTDPDTSTG
ncbi:PE-PPE domain-containing protein [Mycolicibacterium stellerae]|uniref:PE-PPE domain-containing protein n=1 Tax=Mycolicibacterium stellerae TaxID=2358193 RepID=UPI001F456684|nr:PE-PPE domain-containing protein [Mycolicibacterium stellerae]